MKTLWLEGVRCFKEEQALPIRPITLLVGENSTGKSTVLSMIRAAWDVAFAHSEPDFNEQPFDLGGFDSIAHYHGGQAKRAHEFTIGAEFDLQRQHTRSPANRAALRRRVTGTFTERAGQPLLARWETSSEDFVLLAEEDESRKVQVTLTKKGQEIFSESSDDRPKSLSFQAAVQFVVQNALLGPKAAQRRKQLDASVFELMPGGFSSAVPPRPIAGAPIRSKPERTYNPRRETQEPEGSHTPMQLATLHATSKEEFETLARELVRYGREANLFSKIDVKRLGKKAGDPFQVLIAVEKFAFNMRDVGYGVSQILPILVDTLTAPTQQTFLLQQPEVHLHPRAQAALGSLLVEQAGTRRQTFIVETHSDYLLDRVRMDVRQKRSSKSISSTDVIILYFERVAGKATVQPIELDEQGNLSNPPPHYRDFFLNEERKLLGF